MSKNFELMRQAGKGLSGRKSGQITVRTEDSSGWQQTAEMPGSEDSKASDWLRAVGILQKHWKLSLLFFSVVMLTTILVTVFTKAGLPGHGASGGRSFGRKILPGKWRLRRQRCRVPGDPGTGLAGRQPGHHGDPQAAARSESAVDG